MDNKAMAVVEVDDESRSHESFAFTVMKKGAGDGNWGKRKRE